MTIHKIDPGGSYVQDEPICKVDELRRQKAIELYIDFHAFVIFKPIHWLYENVPKMIHWKQNQVVKRDALKRALISHPDHLYFNRKFADFFKEMFVNLGSEAFQAIPELLKPTIKYKLGLSLRYIDYKAEKYTHYKRKFCNSELFSELIRHYKHGCSYAAKSLLGSDIIHLIFERLFMQMSLKIVNHKPIPGKSQYPAVLIRAFAKSLLMHERISQDPIPKGISQEEKIILKLERLKDLGVLSAGLPDPTLLPLTKENLYIHLDHAMYALLEKLCDEWLNILIPVSRLDGVAKAFYLLEGKDLFNTALRHLIGELVIKTYTNPTEIILSVVYAFGVETAEFEAEGFGKGSLPLIMQTAKKLLEKHLESASTSQMEAIFAEKMPKYGLGGRAKIYQIQQLKRTFCRLISNLFHRAIKNEKFDFEESNYKAFRNTTKKIPILGELITGIHLVAKGVFETLKAPFQEKPLMQTLFESLSGKDLANHLTKTLFALIHQPTWRLIVMDVVSELYTHLLEVEGFSPKRPVIPKQRIRNDCGDIALFFLKSAFPRFTPLMTPYRNQLGKTVYRSIMGEGPKNFQKLVEDIIENSLPSIKEETLTTRLLNTFRVYGFNQIGDDRFWNHYIREHLNRNVEDQLKKGEWRLAPSSQSDREAYHAHASSHHRLSFLEWEKKSAWWRIRYREKFVDLLLRLNNQELLKRLLSLHITKQEGLVSWEILPLPPPSEILEEEVKMDKPFEFIEIFYDNPKKL